MKRTAIALSISAAVLFGAAVDNTGDARKDVQLRAMLDEVARAKTLEISGLEKPYFIAFASNDSESASATASLGALINSEHLHARRPVIVLRVGDYKFDNTNSVYASSYRLGLCPIDDDYEALRTNFWLSTDSVFKNAVGQMARKRAALRELADPDDTPDFSPANPSHILQPAAKLNADLHAFEETARSLSARFRTHTDVLQSVVSIKAIASTYRLVTTEGTIVRVPQTYGGIEVRASSLAPDASRVYDHDLIALLEPGQFPSSEALAARVDKVAANVDALAKAPIGEDYSGPVLFEQEAAAQLMAQALADAVRLQRKPVAAPGAQGRNSEGVESVWASRIGSKVFPEWMSAVDDPHQTAFRGAPLAGHYEVDDEGVAAERVVLVDKGTLKSFLFSRQPVRKFNSSNGHGRLPGSYGSEAAAIGNLFINADETVPEAKMKAKLMEAVKTAGLKYGILIRKMDFPSTANFGELQSMARDLQKNGYARTLNAPLLAYRVFPDGREELVRGLHFKEFSAKDLRDIRAASDRPYVLNYVNNGSSFDLIDISSDATTSSVICPSLLLESVDLGRIEEQSEKLPLVPAPALTPQ
ncbi:MAG TPA: metallopeptidase TldD-related protein [Bryobacteraceae bacterium]|nr:metallopeptidase TldD-related protein [Bryobacteraceae bacterium]